MSAAQYDDLNNTLGDTQAFLDYLVMPRSELTAEELRFIAARAAQLLDQVKQSRADIRQRPLRHAIIDTPEEVPQSDGAA